MIVIEDKKIDVAKHNDNVIIVAKQGDTASRFVHAELLFEGAKLAVPSNAQIWVNAKRADGEANAYFGTAHTDGTITVPLNHWMLDSAGYLVCDVSVLENGEKLTSLSFSVDVQEATYTDEAVEEDEDYDVLTSLIIRTETAVTEVERLLEEIGDLPTYVTEIVEEYLSTHPIAGNNVSFNNAGTDLEAVNVQDALAELAARESGATPHYSLVYEGTEADNITSVKSYLADVENGKHPTISLSVLGEEICLQSVKNRDNKVEFYFVDDSPATLGQPVYSISYTKSSEHYTEEESDSVNILDEYDANSRIPASQRVSDLYFTNKIKNNLPKFELYGLTNLTPDLIAENAEAVAQMSAHDKFLATLITDYGDIEFCGYFNFLPTWEFYEAETKTHYRFQINDDGTCDITITPNIDPDAMILQASPTQNTAGDFIGQLALVYSNISLSEIWTYYGTVAAGVHRWVRLPMTSDLNSAIQNKADKTSIVTSGTTFEAADNTEYRFGEVVSLTMTFPATIPDRFDIFVAFTSGATATAFTFPTGIKWTGDDITDGEFVPAASKRYNIALWYDGAEVNGIVRGLAI